MKICDLKQDQVTVGTRIRSLTNRNILGTIVAIDKNDDNYAWVKWDNEAVAFSGFYGNDCECEIVIAEEGLL